MHTDTRGPVDPDPTDTMTTGTDTTAPEPSPPDTGGFRVRLRNFEGPFDLLLGLISQRRLDVTEVALHQVTDDFIAYTRTLGPRMGLDQTTEFLVVAATLLDLKAARLLPSGDVEDPEDLALLEARDLLFARLLQYRAFKDVAATFARRMAEESRRFPRAVPVEQRFAQLLPELVLGLTPDQLAAVAAKAGRPKPPPVVGLDHLHAPPVSVREQAALIVERLRRVRSTSFRALVADASATVVVVARFLALLELFREGAVGFEQVMPLGELTIRWTGADEGEVRVGGDFDGTGPPDGAGPPAEARPPQTGSPETGSPDTGGPVEAGEPSGNAEPGTRV